MKRDPTTAGRTIFLTSVLVAAITTTAVVVMALVMRLDDARRLFDESAGAFDASSPFETASPWLWIALALWIPLVFRKPTLEVGAGMVVALAAAAREWDWHVAFTEYSVLKPPFYYREGTILERIIAGGIMLVVVAAVVVLLARLIHLRPWKRPWPWWVLALGFAFAMLVFTKAVDRAPAILRDDLGVSIDGRERLRMVFYAVEEGLEMMLPVFFAAHALALARWHKHKSAPAT
jgi:hypothetical protein